MPPIISLPQQAAAEELHHVMGQWIGHFDEAAPLTASELEWADRILMAAADATREPGALRLLIESELLHLPVTSSGVDGMLARIMAYVATDRQFQDAREPEPIATIYGTGPGSLHAYVLARLREVYADTASAHGEERDLIAVAGQIVARAAQGQQLAEGGHAVPQGGAAFADLHKEIEAVLEVASERGLTSRETATSVLQLIPQVPVRDAGESPEVALGPDRLAELRARIRDEVAEAVARTADQLGAMVTLHSHAGDGQVVEVRVPFSYLMREHGIGAVVWPASDGPDGMSAWVAQRQERG